MDVKHYSDNVKCLRRKYVCYVCAQVYLEIGLMELEGTLVFFCSNYFL